MERDLDLVRAIVLAIEAQPDGFAPGALPIDGHTEEEIGYHVHIMIEAGLLHGQDITAINSRTPRSVATSLTWAGHEFADAAREEKRWMKAKHLVVTKAGSVTLDVLIKILSSLTMSALGLRS